MNIKRLTIKAKLVLLASTLVLLLFGVGGFSIYVQRQLSYNEHIKLRFKNTWISTLELRKAEKDFLLSEPTNMAFFKTGHSRYLSLFDSLLASVTTDLKKLGNEAVIRDNQLSPDELLTYYDNYQKKFHTLVALRHQRGELDQGLIGRMRKAIHDVEKMKSEKGMTEAQVLSLRRTEKDFLLRKDTTYALKLNHAITGLIESPKVQDSIKAVLGVYQQAFNAIVQIDRQIGFTNNEGLMGELNTSVNRIQPVAEALLEKLDRIIATERTQASTMIVTFLLAGLVVAILVSFFVIRSIIRSMRYAVANLGKIANGDLRVEIDNWNLDEIGVLLGHMQTMAARLKGIVGEIRQVSQHIGNASNEMNATAGQMSEGATEQASSVEEVSSSMEEMTASIRQSTDNSLQTEKLAKHAAEKIGESNEAMHQTGATMKTIEKKISVIGEIARQTNLLALNAAVEAARAGEHGRGFSVVAGEVRKLAERSQQAAIEINELAYTGVQAAQHSGKLLSEVVPDIQLTAVLVHEIAAASIEQHTGSVQVNTAIQQLNRVVQSNAATAEEMAATAEQLNAQATQLQAMIAYFK